MRSVSNFKYTRRKIIAKNAFVKELNKIIIFLVPVALGIYGGNSVSMGRRGALLSGIFKILIRSWFLSLNLRDISYFFNKFYRKVIM